MTADKLATLAKVERLLADDSMGATRAIREALALLRGLLAEPQPDVVKSRSGRLHDRHCHALTHDGACDCPPSLNPGLAEPQVNPSEAKRCWIWTTRDPASGQVQRGVMFHNPEASRAYVSVEEYVAVAGLLAEGEESREPAKRVGRDRFHRPDCAEVLVPGQTCNCAELDAGGGS